MQLTTGLKALALGVVLVTTSACKDDDNDSFSFGLDSTQNSPPVISGTPRTKARAGERYQFTPRAADPDGQPLTFSVANLPGLAQLRRRQRPHFRNAAQQQRRQLRRRHDLRIRRRRAQDAGAVQNPRREALHARPPHLRFRRRKCRRVARSASRRSRRSCSSAATARPSISEYSISTLATAGRPATCATRAAGSRASRPDLPS